MKYPNNFILRIYRSIFVLQLFYKVKPTNHASLCEEGKGRGTTYGRR